VLNSEGEVRNKAHDSAASNDVRGHERWLPLDTLIATSQLFDQTANEY
jgi:hypothetical protein